MNEPRGLIKCNFRKEVDLADFRFFRKLNIISKIAHTICAFDHCIFVVYPYTSVFRKISGLAVKIIAVGNLKINIY